MSVAIDAGDKPLEPTVALENGEPPERKSLKTMLFHGSTWTMIEYGGSQVLRLASNVILTRLLDPPAYAVMFIVLLFTQALDMFSDIGIGPSIIQHKRGGEKSFLNTAWTLQVIRGVFISIAAAIIAVPVSVVYRESMLLYALPIAGLTGVIGGFNSTNLHLLNREVKLARLAFINLGTQIVSVIATVIFALLLIRFGLSAGPNQKLDAIQGAWALIAGSVFSSLIKLVASHVFCPGPRARFEWDSSATHEIVHFGKWILVSTLFGYLATRGDQLILGWYMPTKYEFGLYGIAVMLSSSMVNGMHTISGRVLFPMYARLAEQGPERLRAQTFRVRAVLMVLSLPAVCVVAVWGQQIVNLLYDPKYHDAGYMLQILATGAVVSVIGSTVGPVLLAMGDSYRFMLMQGARTVIMCVTMAGGGYLGRLSGYPNGEHVGVIIGVTLPEVFLYPILVWSVKRYGVWLPKLDFAGLAFAVVFISIGLLL